MNNDVEMEERAAYYKAAVRDLEEQVLIDEALMRFRRGLIERGLYRLFDDDNK